ncbi:hypothetical protein [Actinoplanes sp. NBRC 101535]|uniref:hypothetical protein n=1 Tax=Actinoplanes sp. NBRC 101535 TaxID=3032196 RepID=UPI002552EA05|nr:hypothetical protein [Actinoplanes sp. NBRC 101535]
MRTVAVAGSTPAPDANIHDNRPEACDPQRDDRLVSEFAGMLRQLQGQHLDTWTAQAKQSAIAHLASFAVGLIKDYRRRNRAPANHGDLRDPLPVTHNFQTLACARNA